MWVWVNMLILSLAMPVMASASETLIRPQSRPDFLPPVSELADNSKIADPLAILRPRARPASKVQISAKELISLVTSALTSDDVAANTSGVVLSLSTMGKTRSPRPNLRPDHIVKQAAAKRRARRKDAICGDLDIQGEAIGRVSGRIAGCGAANAVRVRSISGVALSQQATMTCDTARALNSWVSKGLRKAVGKMGGGVASLRVAAHYACRTRNNQPGARISEHGKAKAIDISAIRLQNGDTISVLRDWGKGKKGRVLKKARKSACGPFGTVLGPGSDRFHDDHFHFDSARWGNGPYCK